VPASILSPEEVIRRLDRGPLAPPKLTESDVWHPKPERWAFVVQLIQVGAAYWAGRPGLHTNVLGWTSRPAEALFAATAPQGQWVWWTLVQHLVVGHRYEFLYMDAVTGTATSHCADEVGQGPREMSIWSPSPAHRRVRPRQTARLALGGAAEAAISPFMTGEMHGGD
jgi:hypothetical protein